MNRRPTRSAPITVMVPVRSRHEDQSRQQRGKCTEHIAHLLHAGKIVIARK